jgi:hypothetical protein
MFSTPVQVGIKIGKRWRLVKRMRVEVSGEWVPITDTKWYGAVKAWPYEVASTTNGRARMWFALKEADE